MNRERGTHGSGEGAETFERWYRAHHARLLAQCTRMLRDRAAAEDVAQETLLRAWLGRDQMREEDVGAWLSVVARNLCISFIRRQKKQVPTEFLPEKLDEAADPALIAERTESRRAVRRAMRQVGERHRTLLFRREIEGVDYEELSAEIGLTPGGTRTIVFRARQILRERLAAVGEGVGAIVLGLRARARVWIGNLNGPVEAAASPLLQVGLIFVLTGTIAVSAGGVTNQRTTPIASAQVPAVVAALHAGATLGGATGTVQMEPRPAAATTKAKRRSPPVTPGLDPGGNFHPHGPSVFGIPIDLGSFEWEPYEGPAPSYPWEGSKTKDAMSAAFTYACERHPEMCE